MSTAPVRRSHCLRLATLACLLASCLIATAARAVTFEQAQAVKVGQLEKAAANAVAQQRKSHYDPIAVEAEYVGIGGVTVEPSTEWDIDGDGRCLKVTLRNIPANFDHVKIADRLAIRFVRPMNLLEKSTGLALWIHPGKGLSADLRFGAHIKSVGTDRDPVIISDTPLVQKFGDDPHQAYLDWGYCFSHEVQPMRGAPRELFAQVEAVELTFVQKRIPRLGGRNPSLAPVSGSFYLDGVQLVDWYEGSYDSDRFPADGPINASKTLTSQGRTQQVAVICARYGGESGAVSAIRALDMMARIQCWDGSWPEMATRLQGETTHGMILADMARALEALREQKRPELNETVTCRQWTMTRDALYEQMVYRAAMSRAPAPMRQWADTYFSGDGALRSGCNRPMYFTVAQYVAAGALTDPAKKRQVLAEYDKNMDDLVAYQGITTGGWPIFGEGNRYGGRGLHWDVGYTTDHVFIMAVGSRETDDPRWGLMMRKFDTVVEAMMLSDGLRIDGGLSERGRGRSGSLKAPDITYQQAKRHGADKLAQWGANVSARTWSNWPDGGSLWPYASSARGYGLGAFLTWLTYDMDAEPVPQDLGHVFPRQWPTWTVRWMDKQGKQARDARLIVRPGREPDVHTFAWEVGQYPVAAGIPLAIDADVPVVISDVAVSNEFDARKLADCASATLKVAGESPARSGTLNAAELFDGVAMPISGSARVEVTLDEPKVTLAFTATVAGENARATLKCRLLKAPEPYNIFYGDESDTGGRLLRQGVNLAAPSVGAVCKATGCYPNSQYPIAKALDGNAGTTWVIGGFRPGSRLSFSLPCDLPLASLTLCQGDYRDSFDVAAAVTVTLADGTEKKLVMDRTPGKDFTIDLGGAVSDTLTITLDQTHKVESNSGAVGGWAKIEIAPYLNDR